jgi:hypothetical protein
MAFNFGSLANVKPASTTSYLKAYTINENVTIKSSEITSGTSATTGKPWKCLKITFGNDATAQEIGLPITSRGLVMPCGCSGRKEW